MSLDRKVAIVDLTTGKIDIKPIPLEVRKQFLGGRGLAAYLLYKHSKPGCDPLSPDNAVIFSAGILGGMCARVCPTETLCEEACVREAAEGKPVEIGRLQREEHAVVVRSAPPRPVRGRWFKPGDARSLFLRDGERPSEDG